MDSAFDGDLVRPLGFVTLHAAYAEGELDELLSVLPADGPYSETMRQWPVGKKLRYAYRLASKLNTTELANLLATLIEAKELFAKRNELVHGRLFAGGRLVSNRTNQPERRITEAEIVRLADDLFKWKEKLWHCRCRDVIPLLDSTPVRNDA